MLINNFKQKYIIADFETCNLNLYSKDNKPWQLSYLIVENGKISEIKDHYLWWDDLNISPEAKRITKFNEEKYKQIAEDPLPVLKKLDSYCYNKDYIVIGHNFMGFDTYIHMIYRNLLGFKTDYSYINENRIIDTNCLQKAILKEISFNEKSLSKWQFKLKDIVQRGLKTNLGACCKHFDIDFDDKKAHDAKYDIRKNLEVFKKQIWRLNI